MKIAYSLMASAILLMSCSKETSRFEIKNSSSGLIQNVIIEVNSNSHSIGDIEAGASRVVEFNNFVSKSYNLSYTQNDQIYNIDLCYEGSGTPAVGLVNIFDDQSELKCE